MKVFFSQYVPLISMAIAVVSLLLNFVTLRRRRKLEQSIEAARLHKEWWSEKMDRIRRNVIVMVKEWEDGEVGEDGKRCETPILRSYRDDTNLEEEEREKLQEMRYDIGTMAYFFADLNAFLDEGLVSSDFAYRLFSQSQFAYVEEFLLEVASIAKQAENNSVAESNTKKENPKHQKAIAGAAERKAGSRGEVLSKNPRWYSEVESLKRKFLKIEKRRRWTSRLLLRSASD